MGGGVIRVPETWAVSMRVTALMGGHVEMSVLSLSLIHPQLQAGKLRALLISKKTPEFPNVPTLKQLGSVPLTSPRGSKLLGRTRV
jgi:tripartite-type tricarboxylate transporter receptor subunit TctC